MSNEPAFSRPAVMQGPDDGIWDAGHEGMTTRTYAFVAVLAGYAANPHFAHLDAEQIAERALHLTTVGLAKLAREKGESS